MRNLARLLPALPLLWIGIAPAQTPDNAPDSIVEMYGMAMPFFDNAKTTHATVAPPADKPTQVAAAAYTGLNDPARNRITVGTSQWGFRGYERLTRDVRLVWQLESAFQIDQNTPPGLGGRDSKVGLAAIWPGVRKTGGTVNGRARERPNAPFQGSRGASCCSRPAGS